MIKRKWSDKVSVCGIVGIPGSYGGFETLVENLVLKSKMQFIVFVDRNFKITRHYNNVEFVKLPFLANGLESIIFDFFCVLISCIKGSSAILLLGTPGALIAPLKYMFKVPIVCNIAGLEWGRSKWGFFARLVLKSSERMAAMYSDILICDNLKLCEYVQKTYSLEPRYIAYGGDQFENVQIDNRVFQEFDITFSDYNFALARAQPDNNLEMIASAHLRARCNIVIVTNWSNSEFGRAFYKKYNGRNIKIIGPLFDKAKLKALRASSTSYIHGHSAGGTNPALVEAMWSGRDIIAFSNGFNEATTDYQAAYFEDELALTAILADRCRVDGNGSQMRKIAERQYTWDSVSEDYEDVLRRVASDE